MRGVPREALLLQVEISFVDLEADKVKAEMICRDPAAAAAEMRIKDPVARLRELGQQPLIELDRLLRRVESVLSPRAAGRKALVHGGVAVE